MNLKLDTTTRRFAFAVAISLLLHGLILWLPGIRMPHFESTLPPIVAKLEPLPTAPARHKTKRRIRPAAQKTPPVPPTQAEPPAENTQLAASNPVAAEELAAASAPETVSEPVATETLATETRKADERPLLPKHAQLTFNIYWGAGLVGEAVHTLEIDNGRYVLYAVTRTVGLTRLFKSYELTQHSSGTYGKYGLQPEQYFEERKESSSSTLRNTVEFDRAAQLAHFSNGKEMALPPDTLDFLSNIYQFPPLQGATIAPVSVSNGKKIEHYDFEITPNEEIETPMGKLLTVRLHKLHNPNEEGLEIWLARQYRLFPVKIRFIEKNGDITGEAVITDIRVSEEQGEKSDAVN